MLADTLFRRQKCVLSLSCPSVRYHGTTRLPLDGFWWNMIFEFSSEICPENSSLNKTRQEKTVLYMKTFSRIWQYLAKFFLEWEIFQIKVVQKIKTHILCSIPLFRKSYRLWDNVEKYGGVRGAANDVRIWCIRIACWISKATCTQAHAHARAHASARAHKHIHTQICNIYCFSTATMIHEHASLLRYTYIVCLIIYYTHLLYV
jgi:hypothetical protein